MSYVDDIPLSIARAAHAGTSFDPDRRGDQERAGYAATMVADLERLTALADTDEKRAELEQQFARYRAAYRERVVKYLGSRGRCVSTMIAGPSKFPARRMARLNAIVDKRGADLVEFRTRALAAIRTALRPEDRPIMAGDDDATTRLRAKLDEAVALQAKMTSANAAIRKHARRGAAAQIEALVALGLSEGAAGRLLEPDFCGRRGFADFELQNNGANIRRMQQRLQALEVAKATPAAELVGELARLEDAPAENRVRLFFPGKPSEEVRTRLKRGGFRWAPSLGCWQAYRNPAALTTARDVAGLVSLRCVCGPGDQAEPIVTVMMPDES